jgi:1,4-alpha-glucan branching enzyme
MGRVSLPADTVRTLYGGSNVGNGPGIRSEPVAWHVQSHSVTLSLPALGALRRTGP